MTTTASLLDIRHFMTKNVASVFETMLSIKATLAEANALPPLHERIVGSVGLGGERLSGAVYLHLPANFARVVAASMLGLTVEEVSGESEENDVVGELTNMLAGQLKSALCDLGYLCAVSTPGIIRGSTIEIEAPPEVTQESVHFDCNQNHIAVEVHLKYN